MRLLLPVLKVVRVDRGLDDRADKVIRDRKELLGIKAHREPPGIRVIKVVKVHRVHKDLKDLKAHRVLRAEVSNLLLVLHNHKMLLLVISGMILVLVFTSCLIMTVILTNGYN